MHCALVSLRLLVAVAVLTTDSTPSADCYSKWGGTWKDEHYGYKFTMAQDGCNVTLTKWVQAPNGGYSQWKEHYQASGDVLNPPPAEILPYTISKDGESACCCHGDCSYRWTRAEPDPPKPPLPSCLPEGGCPIQFADGVKPPCCNGGTIKFQWSGPCNGHSFGGYPTSGFQCVKCLDEGSDCYYHKSDCCDGYSCNWEGISGWYCRAKRSQPTNTTYTVV